MYDSSSYPVVTVKCEKVFIKVDDHQDHKPLIFFTINPTSTHYERFSELAVNNTFTTPISGPELELNLTDYLALTHSMESREEEAYSDLLRAFFDFLSGLDVISIQTRHDIVDLIFIRAQGPIAEAMDHSVGDLQRLFDLEVSVEIKVYTYFELSNPIDDDDDDDENANPNDNGDDDEEVVWMVPAAEAAIEGLERIRVDDVEVREKECMICMEVLGLGCDDEVCRLGCLHLFHGNCLRAWLRKSHYCPLCRFQLPVS